MITDATIVFRFTMAMACSHPIMLLKIKSPVLTANRFCQE